MRATKTDSTSSARIDGTYGTLCKRLKEMSVFLHFLHITCDTAVPLRLLSEKWKFSVLRWS